VSEALLNWGGIRETAGRKGPDTDFAKGLDYSVQQAALRLGRYRAVPAL
jgi:hypothetical protein